MSTTTPPPTPTPTPTRQRLAQLEYEKEFIESHPDADCWGPDDELPSRFYEMYGPSHPAE